MAGLDITSVRGQASTDGDLLSLVVRGTAAGCPRVRVVVQCRGERRGIDVGVTDDAFTATFSPADLGPAECACGGQVTVTAVCVDDPERHDTWTGQLSCEAEHAGGEPTEGTPVHGCVDRSTQLLDCTPPGHLAGPQYTLPYHRALPFDPQAVDVHGDPDTPALRLAGVRVDGLDLSLAVDLLFHQDWYFQTLAVSDVVSTIALAPSERLKISIKKTQRKLFQQDTLDSVEKLESTESTIIDKDIINVTRSTSETENWKVDGNGGLRLGAFNLGVSAGYSKSINNTAQTSLQRIADSTVKSARSLKSLQKVEVKEQVELTAEELTARTLQNPYPDRTLTVKVYSLGKSYCVETHCVGAEPAMLLSVTGLTFDRDFVLSCGSFLSEHLLDADLRVELPAALEAVSDFRETDNEQRAIQLAGEALRYLFHDPPNIFDVQDPSPLANSPESSLVVSATAGGKSGLQDAIDNGYPLLLTTLSFYYRIYIDYQAKTTPLGQDAKLPLDLALSLERTLGPVWSATTEKTLENRGNLIDTDDSTEAFRRLAGFLSLVSGVVRPLVQYAEKEEEEARLTARKAELVIDRTMRHLSANSDYYTEQYLGYVGTSTALRTVKQFARSVLLRLTGNSALSGGFDEVFDLEEAYLHRNQIIVPVRQGKSHADIVPFSSSLSADHVEGIAFERPDTRTVVVPFDGIHLEAATGTCVLANVPPEPHGLVVDGELTIHTGGER